MYNMGNNASRSISPETKDFYGNITDVTYCGKIIQVISENKFVIIVKIPYSSSRKYIVKGYGYKSKSEDYLKDNISIINKYINSTDNNLKFYFHGMDRNGTLLVTVESDKITKTLNETMKESNNNEVELNYSIFGTVI